MPPDCQPCEMAHRIEMLEQDSQRNHDKFEAIGERLARNDEKYTQIIRDTSEIKNDLKETKIAIQALNAKPGKRWDGLVDKAIWAVVGAVIVFLLTRLGIG